MLRNKKAAVEMQFHWIYVVLVGTALLILFSAIILQQKKNAEEKIDRILLSSIETAMINAHSKQGLSSTIEGKIRISTECGTNSIIIGNAVKQTGSILFASKTLTGNKLILSSLSWNVPFRAANLLVATTNDEQIVIIYDKTNAESNALFEKVMSIWPSDLSYETEINDRAAKRLKILYLGTDVQSQSFKAKEVIAVKVTPGEGEAGELAFYTHSGNIFSQDGNALSYAGDASIIAALFSGSRNAYECGMGKAYDKLIIVAKVNGEKASQLRQMITLKSTVLEQCKQKYSELSSAFDEIAATPAQDVHKKLEQKWQTIHEANMLLIRNSCLAVY